MKVLFINHKKSQCGVYEFGRNIGLALKKSKYEFLYHECSSTREVRAIAEKEHPDLIIYNYNPSTMGWLNKVFTRSFKCPQLGIIHEVTQRIADRADSTLFDFHIAHDPTLEIRNPLVFRAGRLIPHYENKFELPSVPTIGNFGFAGAKKGHRKLVEMVQSQFDQAVIRINMPFATFGDTEGTIAKAVAKDCRKALTKKGIKLEISHDFLQEPQLLDFLAQNTINLFLYEETGEQRGISAATDMALAVDRPLGVSRQSMFRHILGAEPSVCVEDSSITEIIKNGTKPLEPFYNQWTEETICRDYEQIVFKASDLMTKRKAAPIAAARKLSGLFINCIEAQDSIYESGRMAFECLQNSEKYSLDYIEITPDKPIVPTTYDFYFFNYHITTMSWLDTASIRNILPGVKMTMVLEISPNDPFVLCSSEDFDVYCVLDPTLNIDMENVFAFPRPLEVFQGKTKHEPGEIPVIGSFGFATPGKGFEHIIEAVNKEFERAVVRLNIPYATYADESGKLARKLAKMCKAKAKAGIEVIVTHDFMSKTELMEWCSQNTLNCFLYDRNRPGLAATTDQAISSGRPLIISKNDTFRHIEKFIKPYPQQTLKEAIENTQRDVEEIQKAWAPLKFRERFEEVLDKLRFDERFKAAGEIESAVLAIKGAAQPASSQNFRDRLAIKTRLRNFIKGKGLTR